MVQTYVKYQQDQNNQFRVLNPNIKKIYLKNLFTVAGAVFLIAGFLLMLHLTIGLDVFLFVFEVFNIEIDPLPLLLFAILGVVSISIFLLLGNFLVAKNTRYEFYQNRLILYKNTLLVFTETKEILYQNIIKITYNKDGIFNSLFNSGTIILELTAMKEGKAELEFIDNIEQTVQYIQKIITEFRNIQQAQFAENYKIGNILNKL